MPQNIFSKKSRLVLEAFVNSNVLLAFDYDGTLAPIVTDPKKAIMRPKTTQLLKMLAEQFPVVVISGRGRDDVLKFLPHIPLLETLGNHGIEPWQSSQKIKAQVKRIKSYLHTALPPLQGTILEDKVYSLSLHYRRSRSKKIARREILKAVQNIPSVRILGGKQVINVIPEDGPHKGIALHRAMKKFGCSTSIFVGDDVTDEDVFSMDTPGEILGIRIGNKKDTSASHYIAKQLLIDKFLKLLLDIAKISCRSVG